MLLPPPDSRRLSRNALSSLRTLNPQTRDSSLLAPPDPSLAQRKPQALFAKAQQRQKLKIGFLPSTKGPLPNLDEIVRLSNLELQSSKISVPPSCYQTLEPKKEEATSTSRPISPGRAVTVSCPRRLESKRRKQDEQYHPDLADWYYQVAPLKYGPSFLIKGKPVKQQPLPLARRRKAAVVPKKNHGRDSLRTKDCNEPSNLFQFCSGALPTIQNTSQPPTLRPTAQPTPSRQLQQRLATINLSMEDSRSTSQLSQAETPQPQLTGNKSYNWYQDRSGLSTSSKSQLAKSRSHSNRSFSIKALLLQVRKRRPDYEAVPTEQWQSSWRPLGQGWSPNCDI